MKKNLGMFMLVLWGCCVLFSSSAKAADQPAAPSIDDLVKSSQGTSSNTVSVATVNIYNAKIDSQSGSTLNISFDLNNREGVQPQVLYGVMLVQNQNGQQVVVDQNIYSNDVVSLGAGETIHKTVQYSAPTILSGNYEVYLESRNFGGLLFAQIPLGSVTLSGSDNGIVLSNCSLAVQGENPSKKYTITQGVDVASKETLVAHCDMTNSQQGPVSATPVFSSYARTVFGKALGTSKGDAKNVAAGKSADQTFIIPKASDPQAYDTVLVLQDGQGNVISNKVDVHYVVDGLSATIENVRLDKDLYEPGDSAAVQFLWYTSADSFPGSRNGATTFGQATLSMSLVNEKQEVCSNTLQRQITKSDEGKPMDITLNITKQCVNPTLAVSITSQDGKVLASENFAIASQNIPAGYSKNSAPASSTTKAVSVLEKMFAALVVIVLIVVLVVYLKRKKSGMIGIFFTAFLLGSMFVKGAHADTFVTTIYITSDDYVDVQYTISLNKSTYTPGEAITASGSVGYGQCSNGSGFDTPNFLTATINNSTQTIINGDANSSGSAVFTAQNTAGSYSAAFNSSSFLNIYGGYTGYGSASIGYTVVGTPGSCNTAAAGQSFMPSAFLPLEQYGDPTGDGTISAADMTQAMNAATSNPSSCTLASCDVNASGTITSADALLINNMANGTAATKLCSAGIETGIASTGSGWSWTCKGTNGTADSSCSAIRLDPINGATQQSVDGGTFTTDQFEPLKEFADPNGDGAITGTSPCTGGASDSDACVILRKAVGFSNACTLENCDLNGDGAINVADALLALRMSAGISPSRLCSVGIESGLTTTANGWQWVCKGLYGGSDATGKAYLPTAANGACSAISGQALPAATLSALSAYGMPNGDGAIDTSNLSQVINASIGFSSTCTLASCDLDSDGLITSADATLESKMTTAVTPTKLCAAGFQKNTLLSGSTLSWTCAGTRTGTTTDASCSATTAAPVTLTVNASQGVTVTSALPDTTINCNSGVGTCSATYAVGTAVSLKSTLASGSNFTGWSGACSGTDPSTCSFTISSNESVTASACSPSNSCAANTCTGSTCDNGCGTMISGTKDCTPLTPSGWHEVAP